MSFNNAIAWLVTNLALYQPLQDYGQANFGKAFTITRRYKPRIQIQPEDLPLVMVTRPSVAKSYQIGARDGEHVVSLYVGFYQPDVENNDSLDLAQRHIVTIEELVDDFLMANLTLGGTAISAFPTNSENDEGFFHPVYFNRMDCAVQHRRPAA